ncbi:hypothetical protein [Paenibacillus sp. IHBB 10380]|uniref:hypothetical protein n=1 Tax=Paenibacillus sp. IHBB 10380 TaxID=1566358 RepID=UPI0005CFED85|nr:hypothetical protein [Paenibacillus sp. IHBB 10380]AJS58194.1 hypothetical protein UB51_06415 [Paenibacillus sp. IHBB 10380]
MNQNTNKFKSKFCQWAQSNIPNDSMRKFTYSLNQVLNKHIFDSDNRVQIMIRSLADSGNLNFSYISNEVIIAPNKERESLYVGVLMPSWDKGLRDFCKDEYVYDSISWFFHYASQYVARSRIVDVISSLSIIYDRSCDFRGDKMLNFTTPKSAKNKDEFILAFWRETHARFHHEYRARERNLVSLVNKINALDPFIHRIFFNYLHAYKLYEGHFDEEAITSLDKTVDVIQQYARERMNINGTNNQREITLNAFGMDEREKYLLSRLYDIRNFFGGHPSISKWWDFSEMFEGDIKDFFDVIRRLLYKVVLHENENRKVEKNPSSWSQWFEENAMLLWESVWFEKIHKQIR